MDGTISGVDRRSTTARGTQRGWRLRVRFDETRVCSLVHSDSPSRADDPTASSSSSLASSSRKKGKSIFDLFNSLLISTTTDFREREEDSLQKIPRASLPLIGGNSLFTNKPFNLGLLTRHALVNIGKRDTKSDRIDR